MALKAMTTDWGRDELVPTINNWVNDGFKAKPPVYKQFIKETTTTEFFIEEARRGGFTDFPLLDEGGVLNYSLPERGDKYRIQPEERQMAFAITRRDKQFNRINKVEMYSRDLSSAADRTIEKIAVMPLNLAFDSGTTLVDGQPLLSTTHRRLSGDITANTPSTQADLTMDSLEAAVTAFGATKGEDGGYISMVPKYLVVGNANMINGMRILNATSYFAGSNTQTNTPTAADTGVLNVLKGMGITLIVDNYLTDPDAWFLLADTSDSRYQLLWNEKKTPYGFDDQQTRDTVYSLSFSCIAAITTDLGIYGSSGA